MIASHEITDDEGRTGTVNDVWKDRKTGRVFRLEEFEGHRRSESVRMTYTWFMYGLIGCAFFAFRQSRLAGKKFTVALVQAIAVNLAALFTYTGLEGTNDRIRCLRSLTQRLCIASNLGGANKSRGKIDS